MIETYDLADLSFDERQGQITAPGNEVDQSAFSSVEADGSLLSRITIYACQICPKVTILPKFRHTCKCDLSVAKRLILNQFIDSREDCLRKY
jgi:hypothetical protein